MFRGLLYAGKLFIGKLFGLQEGIPPVPIYDDIDVGYGVTHHHMSRYDDDDQDLLEILAVIMQSGVLN